MDNNGLNRIYLYDILAKINKKDIRSVIKWCEDNEVSIFSDTSGKFVIHAEFELAYNRPVINLYIKKYGEKWEEVYNLAIENNLHLFETNENPSKPSIAYKPVSHEAQDFLKKCA